MNMRNVILNVGMVIIIVVMVVAIATVSACQVVDTTQAKFERGQMVEFKAGGIEQIVRRYDMNEGTPWNLTPVFRYEVRRENG